MALSWNDVSPSPDSRVIYVSADGDDMASGLTPTSPKRTVTAGLALLRHGFPDHLLLRRGDVFPASATPATGIRWKTSGRGASEPTVFGAYGDTSNARPKLLMDGKAGLEVRGGGGTPIRIDYVAIIGIDFDSGARPLATNAHGLRFQLNMSEVLVEDCRIHGFFNGITAQMTGGMIEGLAIRGCQIDQCYSLATASDPTGGHSQGIYADEVTDLLIEGCTLDHLGWSETVSAAHGKSIFKHGLYIQGDARNVTIRNNVIANASSHGAQMRSGGVCDRNVFIQCAIGLLLAGDGAATKNVITKGTDIGTTQSLARRFGIDIQNVPTGARIAWNMMVHTTNGQRGVTIQPLEYPTGVFLGSHNVLTENNILFAWGGVPYRVVEVPGTIVGSSIHSGLIEQNNRWEPDAVSLVDSLQTIETYSTKNGGDGTIQNFIDRCLSMSRYSWSEAHEANNIAASFARAYAEV